MAIGRRRSGAPSPPTVVITNCPAEQSSAISSPLSSRTNCVGERWRTWRRARGRSCIGIAGKIASALRGGNTIALCIPTGVIATAVGPTGAQSRPDEGAI
jgi:hypothetical protein